MNWVISFESGHNIYNIAECIHTFNLTFYQQKKYDLVVDEEIKFVLIDSITGNQSEKVLNICTFICIYIYTYAYHKCIRVLSNDLYRYNVFVHDCAVHTRLA